MLTNIMGEIKKHNIEIVETIMVGRLKAVYIDSYIFIDKRLSTKEKICILAEELHHHIYDYGDISSKNMNAYKYELTTRRRTFEYLLPLHKIKKARKLCVNVYEMANELNVTETFLLEALKHYEKKYGIKI